MGTMRAWRGDGGWKGGKVGEEKTGDRGRREREREKSGSWGGPREGKR